MHLHTEKGTNNAGGGGGGGTDRPWGGGGFQRLGFQIFLNVPKMNPHPKQSLKSQQAACTIPLTPAHGVGNAAPNATLGMKVRCFLLKEGDSWVVIML